MVSGPDCAARACRSTPRRARTAGAARRPRATSAPPDPALINVTGVGQRPLATSPAPVRDCSPVPPPRARPFAITESAGRTRQPESVSARSPTPTWRSTSSACSGSERDCLAVATTSYDRPAASRQRVQGPLSRRELSFETGGEPYVAMQSSASRAEDRRQFTIYCSYSGSNVTELKPAVEVNSARIGVFVGGARSRLVPVPNAAVL